MTETKIKESDETKVEEQTPIDHYIDTQTDVETTDGTGVDDDIEVGCITRDVVALGDETIVGDSEPNYDGSYQRQEIKLIEVETDRFANANHISFKSSMEWVGPFVALMVFDSDGARVSRCDVPNPQVVTPNTRITVEPGKAIFHPIVHEDDSE